ncbi:MAG TPA: 6-carboxytetrahydropterin synthase, partial [Candidatus Eremiobacteraceae bacterium]|nr:6-carboxytetrahydropterin synthase [Candidatus Eremiobacteraceae bacterium]
MIAISFSCHIDAAHQLSLPYDSPCNRRHGHRYGIEISASAHELEHGMVVDFNVLQKVVDEFDHCDLNDRPEFRVTGLATTAENIAIVLSQKLQHAVGERVSIDEVVVRETP